jgi:DNA-directed RNA polymerase specialized sigma24 family protein
MGVDNNARGAELDGVVMELHAWKRDWLKRIRAAEGNVLAVGPTGCGKTVIAAHLMRKGRVLFIAHTRELVDQAVKRCAEWGVTGVEVLRPGEPMPKSRVIIASKQTLERRPFPKVEVVIFDEAHHLPSAGWARIHEHYRKAGAKIYGLTATPIRLDGKPMSDFFDSLVQAPSTSELSELGHIAVPRVWAPKRGRPDLRGVRISGRDFESRSVSEVLSKREIVGSVVDHWKERAGDKLTVVYAVNVEHAWVLANAFGDCAAVLQGNMKTEERDEILGLFAKGTLRVLVNCQILTEGWDCPAAKCVVLARPTLSFGLLMQMVGRISRPNGAKPLVLDLVDNFRYFDSVGLNPLGDIEYSLDKEAKESNRNTGKCSLKTCPDCECLCPSGTRTCECGHEFFGQWEQPEVHGELEEWFTATPLTLSQVAEICNRRRNGESIRSLSMSFNRSEGTITRILRRGGVIGVAHVELTQEQKEIVCAKYENGESAPRLSKEFGVSSGTIYRALKDGGVKSRKPGESIMVLSSEQKLSACEMYRKGECARIIAEKLGVSDTTIIAALRAQGVKLRTGVELFGGLTDQQKVEVCARYTKGENSVQLSKEFGVSVTTVRESLKSQGVKLRTGVELFGGLTDQQKVEVCARYTKGENSVQLSKEFGVSVSSIIKYLRSAGVKVRNLSESRGGLTDEQKVEACKMYKKGKTAREVARLFGVDQETVLKALRKAGVVVRSPSESRRLSARKRHA